MIKRILCLLLACSQFSLATYSFVQVKEGGNSTGSIAVAYTNSVGANHLLLAHCAMFPHGSGLGVSDGSNTWVKTFASDVEDSAGDSWQNLFYVIKSNSGAATVTCWNELIIYEYSGLDTTNPFDVASSSVPLTTSTLMKATAMTTKGTNELIWMEQINTNANESGASGTVRIHSSDNTWYDGEDQTQASPASGVQASFNYSSAPGGAPVFLQAGFCLTSGCGASSAAGVNKINKLMRLDGDI
jgi:hypothetical protein